MEKKKVIAIGSALMIGTTTALVGVPTPVMAEETPEVIQEVMAEENKTEQSVIEKNVTEDTTAEKTDKVEQKDGSVAIDEAHFPDPEFRMYLKNTLDSDKDGMFSDTEMQNIKEIVLSDNPALKSLKGIEYFPNLVIIDCHNTGLTSLDVTNHNKLGYLWVSNTAITSLDVSNKSELTDLICDRCENLKELNVLNNPTLSDIDCSNTAITSLDVSSCPYLRRLKINATKINSIDVTHNPALSLLHCMDNGISELDVTNNPQLKYLYCDNNKLQSLDVSHNPVLDTLNCKGNELSALNISANPKLTTLYLMKNKIKTLDVQNNLLLEILDCSDNPIPELDLSKNLNLDALYCYNTQIKGLDVSKNLNLKKLLYRDSNEFYPTWLNIGNNTVLDKNKCSISSTKKNIKITGNTFNLRDNTDKKIDLSKVNMTSNGKLDKKTGIVTVMDTSKPVEYEYDCGTAKGEKITLNVKFILQTDVVGNTAPTISAKDITLNVGDKFDPLANVKAEDKEDGPITLTNANIIANNVNTGKAGTYHVTYKVTDKEGLSTEKTITVIVEQKIIDINGAPTISAKDVTLNVGDKFDPLANVKAEDKEDGPITLTNANIIANDVNTGKAGTYHVTYRVTDKQGASTEKTIIVTVEEKMIDINGAPTISAKDVILNVGDKFDPLANVKAEDKEDGPITLTNANIIANDVNTEKAGTYHVTYKVTDKQGISTEKTITVTVKAKDINVKPEQPQKPNGQSESPKTGDIANIGLFTSLFATSSGILAVLLGKKRKKSKNN